MLAGGAAGLGAVGTGLLSAGTSQAADLLLDPRYALRDRLALNVRDFGALGNGVTDDTPAIRTALAQPAPPGAPGVAVFIPPGRYPITELKIPSNTELFGAGWVSQLVVSPSAALWPIWIQRSTHDVRLHDFAIDGNRAAYTGPEDGGPGVALIADGFYGACQHIYVERLRVFDQLHLGIVFQSVVDGAIRDCLVEDNDRDGITVYYNSKRVLVAGNQVCRCGDDYIGVNSEDVVNPAGQRLSTLCEDIVVADNLLVGPGRRTPPRGPGITVRGGKGIAIQGNRIRDVSQSGIKLQDFNATPLTDVKVASNQVSGTGVQGAADAFGICVIPNSSEGHPTETAHIRNVTIEGNTLTGTKGAAINLRDDRSPHLDDDLRDVLVAGNAIEGSQAEGIVIPAAGASDVVIHGNRVKGSAGIGIDATAGKRIFVKDNVVYRGATTGIRISGVDTASIENNQSYDDRAGTAATQTRGIEVNALAGQVAFRDNQAWGNKVYDYDVHWGSHGAATFNGPARVLSGNAGWGPLTVPSGGMVDTKVTVQGADVGAPCTVGFNQPLGKCVFVEANVTAFAEVTVTLENRSGAALNLPAGTLFVHVEVPPPA